MKTFRLNIGTNDANDKFYTKPNVCKECCDIIKQIIDINYENDIIIEPSAGNGSFIPEILKMSLNCSFYDIQPEHPIVLKQDYLYLDTTNIEIPDINSKIHVIGNPPFGRQSSLAIKFIKKSSEFCDTISFILPKSLKNTITQTHLPLNFHLVHQHDLDDNSFLLDGVEHNVEAIFQIWEKNNKY